MQNKNSYVGKISSNYPTISVPNTDCRTYNLATLSFADLLFSLYACLHYAFEYVLPFSVLEN